MPTSDEITLKDISKLEQHPLNEKVYGKVTPDAKLVESVKKVGVLTPIVVTKAGQILSGARRWLAAQEARIDKIPTRLFEGDELQEEQYLIHANTQRIKNKAQIAREARHLLRIEQRLAVKRIQAGKKVDPEENLAKGRARDLVGKQLGVSGQTVTKMVEIVDKAEAGFVAAQTVLEKLEQNKISVDKAHKAVKGGKKRPTAVPAKVRRKIKAIDKQIAQLERKLALLKATRNKLAKG